jgi:hypothetical protein
LSTHYVIGNKLGRRFTPFHPNEGLIWGQTGA